MQKNIKRKTKKPILDWILIACSPAMAPKKWGLLTVDYRIKVHMDLEADKSTVAVKGPFFPRVVNPRYQIRGTMCNARIQSSKVRKAIL
jgi:hypothetical protein